MRNLAALYRERPETEKAWECLSRALALFESLDDKHQIAQILLDMGTVYRRQSDWDRALGFYQRALAIQNTLADFAEIAKTYNLMGVLQQNRQEPEMALSSFTQAQEIYEKEGHQRGIMESCAYIGNLMVKEQN